MTERKPHQVRSQVRIRASAGKVWGALLGLDQIRQWWGASEGVIEPRKGGPWALAWSDEERGFSHVASGVIRSLTPEKRLRIEPLIYFNAEHAAPRLMRMSVSLTEKDGVTRVIVRQEPLGNAPDWELYCEAAIKGWKETLMNLKRFVEEGLA